ncbi:hypothetical protein TRIUR3_05865 [Triticum urartu]|uniref:Disease resistance N-terminal domain-containing protein n=1 Tax=Triticum urartu TaxID=4572 RepID=M8A9V4_TRIUA|nr:hypothetical protein TRIUR3_05865 [Triticum urartu]
MAATAALVFAGNSVATPAISFIVNKALGYLSEWYKPNDLEELKNNLSEKLTDIQAVYNVVDHQEISEQSNGLAEWLWRFRDAVEEAEDALDEMDYHKLKEEAEAHSLGQGQQELDTAGGGLRAAGRTAEALLFQLYLLQFFQRSFPFQLLFP